MASQANQGQDSKKQLRATALRHALSIEEKKRLQTRVADLIIEAYDLPSGSNANPACPSKSDATLFRDCVRLFQPSDLDDLVQERNIDDRCGYALCPKSRRKIPGGGEKVWNQKGGKDFQLLSKAEIEKWCSNECGDRTNFVRAQLSTEPAWLRDAQNDVRLLDEMPMNELAAATEALSIGQDNTGDMTHRLQELSLERGESEVKDVSNQISIVEKPSHNKHIQPPKPGHGGDYGIEGHQPRKVRFAEDATKS